MLTIKSVKIVFSLSFFLLIPLLLWGQETFHYNISVLADSIGCRYPGSIGDSLSQSHIKHGFLASGQRVIEQEFDISDSVWGDGDFRLQRENDTVGFVHGRDFVVSARSASDTLSLGYAVVRGLPQKDKLSLLNNRIVVVLPNNFGQAGTNRTLSVSALIHAGARAIIYAFPPGRTLSHSTSRGNRSNRNPLAIPIVNIRNEVLRYLFPYDMADALIDDIFVAPSSEKIILTTKHFESTTRSKNIIAVKEGIGERSLVLGAHYDTLAPDPNTKTAKRGANDNASGIAMLLALADRLSTVNLQHSIYFVAFGGEEKGALGSMHFVEHPPIGLDKIDEMINIDMVGRLENDTLYFSQFNSVLLSPKMLCPVSLRLCEGEDSMSDHYDFVRIGIPSSYFNTGKDSMIHTTNDTSDRINYAGMRQILDFLTNYILTIDTM